MNLQIRNKNKNNFQTASRGQKSIDKRSQKIEKSKRFDKSKIRTNTSFEPNILKWQKVYKIQKATIFVKRIQIVYWKF